MKTSINRKIKDKNLNVSGKTDKNLHEQNCLLAKGGQPATFGFYCCRDFDLDPITLIYELDLYLMKRYLHIKNELPR